MLDYNKLIAFFDEYISHYKEFLSFEYSKVDMINKGEIEKLSNSLSTEQAFIMKTNTYETKRLKLMGEKSGESFSQLAENAPKEFRDRLTAQHKEMSELVFNIKELNDMANDIVTERLRKINSRAAELDVYDGKGSVKRESAVKAAISKNA